MPDQQILFVNRFFYPDQSATAQMLSDLAFHLATSRRVVVVTTNGLYDDPDADLPRRAHHDGVEIHRVYRPRYGRSSLAGRAADYVLMYLAFAFAVFKLARTGDVVVAKTDPPLLSVALFPITLLKRAKLINWLQDLYPEVASAFGVKALTPLLPVLKSLRDASLKLAHQNVVIGRRMSERLLSLGVQKSRIAIIQNWCPHDNIRPLDAAFNPLRQRWDLKDKFVVGYSGNLGRAHEIETLLCAAEKLKDEAGIVFLFIGGGALIAPLRAELVRRGLSHLFEFRAYQAAETLPASMTLPDVFWVSLRPEMEGLIVPSKFYSYCAAGRPTIFIGDTKGELAQLIKATNCGLSVKVADYGQLVAAIEALMQSRLHLEAMGRHARHASEKAFAKSEALIAWERLLAQASDP